MPDDERKSYVDDVCPESELRRQVLSVLSAYESATDVFPAAAGPIGTVIQDLYGAGSEIGPYTLEKSLGAGGMGTVYLASRSDRSFDKRVAIKLLKRQWATEEEVNRFKRERQILADLVHPKIAQLLDGGNTPQGHPFLVMEYVEGKTIDAYCRDHPMGLDEKLALFLQVCSAVQFAHQNLIVHRDLKPGNIMVSPDGQAKLLDFGIAKILDSSDFAMTVVETRPGSSPMTLAYASPEQLKGEAITTATDVYALGILLYQILTGQKPYSFDGRNLPAAVDAICNQEVTAPSEDLKKAAADSLDTPSLSTHWREIQGDLDAIVLKALAKDPSQRYASAEQFSDDLNRFRTWQPVRARQSTLLYRTRKLIQRNRFAISAAATILVILLSSIFMLLRQQELLILQKNQAELVSEWMTELFEIPDPGRSLGESVTARELLDKSSKTIREDLKTQPGLLMQMLKILGKTYSNLGLHSEAAGLTEDALDLSIDRGSTSDRIEILLNLAEIRNQQGAILQSYELAREATLLAETGLRSGRPKQALGLSTQGIAALTLNRNDDAEQLLLEAERVARESKDDEILAGVLSNLFFLRQKQDRRSEARRFAGESLELKRKFLPASHPEILSLEQRLLLFDNLQDGGPEGKMHRLREIAEKQKTLYGEDSVLLAGSLSLLARYAIEAGLFEDSKELAKEAIRLGEADWGDSHPNLGLFYSQLGRAELMLAEHAESRRHYRKALEITERELGSNNYLYAVALTELAKIDNQTGQPADAEIKARQALELFESTLGPNHSWVLLALDHLALSRMLQGDLEGAKRSASDAVTRGHKALERSTELSSIILNLGIYEYRLKENDTALKHFEEVWQYEGTRSVLGPQALTWSSFVYRDSKQWADAERESRRAVEAWSHFEGNESWKVSPLETIATAALELGRPREAVRLFQQVLSQRVAIGSSEAAIKRVEGRLARAEEAASQADP